MARYWILGMLAVGAAATANVGQAQPAPSAPASGPPAAAAPITPAAIGPYLIAAVDKVCQPLIQGQKIKQVAEANGLRRSRDAWLLQGQGVERVIISPPTVANPDVCQMTVNFEVGQSQAVVGTLTSWAAAQNPPLQVLSNGAAIGPGVTGWSWEMDDGQAHRGLVFNLQRTADGKPQGRGFETATVLYSSKSGG